MKSIPRYIVVTSMKEKKKKNKKKNRIKFSQGRDNLNTKVSQLNC